MNQQAEIERIVWFYDHGNIPKRTHTHRLMTHLIMWLLH